MSKVPTESYGSGDSFSARSRSVGTVFGGAILDLEKKGYILAVFFWSIFWFIFGYRLQKPRKNPSFDNFFKNLDYQYIFHYQIARRVPTGPRNVSAGAKSKILILEIWISDLGVKNLFSAAVYIYIC